MVHQRWGKNLSTPLTRDRRGQVRVAVDQDQGGRVHQR